MISNDYTKYVHINGASLDLYFRSGCLFVISDGFVHAEDLSSEGSNIHDTVPIES